jgi:uncharacterized protein
MLSLLARLRPASALLLWALLAAPLPAADATPEQPAHYFNDYAGLVSRDVAARLDAKLQRFTEETSTQILVAVMPALPEGEVLEDFTVRTAQAWRAGEKKLDNGAVLFVFVRDRKLRIEVGYGLEGPLPDALARRIIDESIVPAFRAGHPDVGLEAGVDAMMAATRGEYQAPPKPLGGGRRIPPIVIFIIILVVLSFLSSHGGGGGMRGPLGRNYSRRGSTPWIFTGGGGSGWGGGSWGGGGGGGGGGGFSGGGGSFGGGGASGSW